MGKKKKEVNSSEKLADNQQAKPKNPKDDIPGELPSLTQDVLNEAIPDQDAGSDEDIPDELPSLDFNSTPEEKPTEDPFEKLKKDAEEIEKETIVEPKVKPAQVKQEKDETTPLPNSGYFNKIAQNIKGTSATTNLLDGMKDYWQSKQFEEEGLKPASQKGLEVSIKDKIQELQELEARWVEQKRVLEHTKNFATSIEAEISIKAEELKNLLSKLEKVESIYNRIKQNPDK